MTEARERIEFVGGPWDGTDGELDQLPDVLEAPEGRYRRSVRCADDGAMRYVWESPTVADAAKRKESTDG